MKIVDYKYDFNEKDEFVAIPITVPDEIHLPIDIKCEHCFGPTIMCECGKNPATEPHTCPYKEEIEDDHTTLCTCCKECEDQCADDV